MIHVRVQVDPGAQLSVRPGKGGQAEIVILDPAGDASAVIELSPEQLAGLAAAAAAR